MMQSRWLTFVTLGFVAFFTAVIVRQSACAAADSVARPPNIVLILADDLGGTDLGCQGSKYYRTPNLDRLAAEGVRFTSAYSACTVCSPTRAAVLTGQYPARLHITDWIAGHKRPFAKLSIPDWTMHLPHDKTTIAEILQGCGYATLSIGKWHLGEEKYGPLSHGFQTNIGGNDRGQPPSYFFPYERNGIQLPGLEKGQEGEYLTDRLTDEALAWIEAHQQAPFFVYFPHYAVHTPLQAPAKLSEENKNRQLPGYPQQNPTYAAMIENLDHNIGRLLAKLAESKLAENTIVIFTSDNGGLTLRDTTSNLPFRAGKGSAYEGGVRIPLIVRYPAAVKPAVNDTPVMSIDLFPTLSHFAGAEPTQPLTVDGVSLVGLLKNQKPLEQRDLFWHYPHYHPGGATPYSAIRSGDWRLVEFFEDDRVELYNLKNDVSEKTDLAAKEPAKRDELRAKLKAWRTAVGAQLPTPNPAYDKTKDEAPRAKNPEKKNPKKQAAK
jgi:arylsulfatase A-like enzyme